MKKIMMAMMLFGFIGCAHVPAGHEGGKCILGKEKNGSFFAKCDAETICIWHAQKKQWTCIKEANLGMK